MHRSFGADGPLSREPRQVAHDKVKEFIRTLDRDFNELISLPELLEYRTKYKLAIEDETVEAMFKLAANSRQHTQFPGRELNLSHEDVFLAVSCRRSRDPVTRKWSWKASPYHDEWIAMIKCICPQPFNPGAPDYSGDSDTKINTMYERELEWHARHVREAKKRSTRHLHASKTKQTADSAEEVASHALQRSVVISRPPPLAISRRVAAAATIERDVFDNEEAKDPNGRADDAPLDSFRLRQIDFNVQGEFNAIMKGVDERKKDARAVELRAGSLVGQEQGDQKSTGGTTSASVSGTSVAAAKKARTMVITAADRETGRMVIKDTDEPPLIGGDHGRRPWNVSRIPDRSGDYPIAPVVTGPGTSRDEIIRPESTDPLLSSKQQYAQLHDKHRDEDMSGIVEKLAGMQSGGVAVTRGAIDKVASAATNTRFNAARIRRDERRARALLTALEEPETLKRAADEAKSHNGMDRDEKTVGDGEFVAHFHRRQNQDVRLATARDQWDMRGVYNDAALTYRQVKEREQTALHNKLAAEKDPIMVAQLLRDVVRSDRLPFVTCFKDFTDPIPQSQREAVARTQDLLQRESYAEAEDRRLISLGLGSAGFGQERDQGARNSTLNGKPWQGFNNPHTFTTVFKPIHKLTPLARDYVPPAGVPHQRAAATTNHTIAKNTTANSASYSAFRSRKYHKPDGAHESSNNTASNNGSMSARTLPRAAYLSSSLSASSGSQTARSASALPPSTSAAAASLAAILSSNGGRWIPARPYPAPPSSAPPASFTALRRSMMLQRASSTASTMTATAPNPIDDTDATAAPSSSSLLSAPIVPSLSLPSSDSIASTLDQLQRTQQLQQQQSASSGGVAPSPRNSSSVPIPPIIAAEQRRAAYMRTMSSRWSTASTMGVTAEDVKSFDPWPNGLLATNIALGRIKPDAT